MSNFMYLLACIFFEIFLLAVKELANLFFKISLSGVSGSY